MPSWIPGGNRVKLWLRQGTFRGGDLQAHAEAIRRLQPRPEEAYAHDHLYNCLSILDSKAQALLTYDGFLLAAASVVLTLLAGQDVSVGLLVSSLVTSGLSGALSLGVVTVHWSDTQDLEGAGQVLSRLLSMRNRRTVRYRLSWTVAMLSTVLLVAGVLSDAVGG